MILRDLAAQICQRFLQTPQFLQIAENSWDKTSVIDAEVYNDSAAVCNAIGVITLNLDGHRRASKITMRFLTEKRSLIHQVPADKAEIPCNRPAITALFQRGVAPPTHQLFAEFEWFGIHNSIR
jgi:hypothetical protein